MTDELCVAIVSRLCTESLSGDQAIAQTALAGQLATDTDSPSGPAVFQGNRDDAVGFPCITFRPNSGIEALGGIDFGVVREYYFDFEIWTNSRSGRIVPQIADNVEILLDERRGAPKLPVSAGRYFYMEALGPVAPLYDEKINAWAGLMRYRMIAGKA